MMKVSFIEEEYTCVGVTVREMLLVREAAEEMTKKVDPVGSGTANSFKIYNLT